MDVSHLAYSRFLLLDLAELVSTVDCKLAAATMATVFWAGDTFASKRKIKRGLHKTGLGGGNPDDDVGIEEFLQVSMIEAFGALGDRVRDLEAVMGFEVSKTIPA